MGCLKVVYSNIQINSVSVDEGVTAEIEYTVDVTDSSADLRITEKRIDQTKRAIDRSLRTFTTNNRKKIKLPITDEEKGMALLHQGQ